MQFNVILCIDGDYFSKMEAYYIITSACGSMSKTKNKHTEIKFVQKGTFQTKPIEEKKYLNL